MGRSRPKKLTEPMLQQVRYAREELQKILMRNEDLRFHERLPELRATDVSRVGHGLIGLVFPLIPTLVFAISVHEVDYHGKELVSLRDQRHDNIAHVEVGELNARSMDADEVVEGGAPKCI